jgi:3-hydroxyisobutyrate dehydrogenase
MVGYPADVEDVVLGAEGVLAGAVPGSFLIDFTTSSPSLARRIFQEAQRRQVGALDAPVSGGDVGARNAALSIMVGGERSVFEALRPLLEQVGRTVVYQGPAGMGQHTKMVNQIVIGSTMIGVCEGLLYARRCGLDPETVLANVGSGAAASWTLSNLLPRILRRDYAPGFMVEHFVKDMGIALEECRRMNLELPGLKLACRLYKELVRMKHGRSGTQALMLALEKLQEGPASRD